MRRNSVMLVAVAILVAACGTGEADDSVDVASSGCAEPTSGVAETIRLEVGEEQRVYDVYVPESADGPMPVVLSYHGFTQSSEAQAELSRLESAAETDGFIAVFPQGSQPDDGAPPYFNIETIDEPALAEDVEFTEAVLDEIEAEHCVDRSRIYAMGWSNGGMFASTLACQLSDRIAAVAPVAGVLMLDDCGERSVPILITHGTADPLVPFDGDDPDHLRNAAVMLGANEIEAEMFGGADLDVLAYVDMWVAHNGCDLEPATEEVASEVTVFEYGSCESGADVVFQVVDGGGHAWPGTAFDEGRTANLGYATTAIDVTADALEFFDSHVLPSEYLSQ